MFLGSLHQDLPNLGTDCMDVIVCYVIRQEITHHALSALQISSYVIGPELSLGQQALLVNQGWLDTVTGLAKEFLVGDWLLAIRLAVDWITQHVVGGACLQGTQVARVSTVP